MVMWSPGRFFWHQLIRKLGLNIQSFWICSSNFAHSDYINKCREWLAPPPRSYFIQGSDSQTHHNSREGIFLWPSPWSALNISLAARLTGIDFNFLQFNKVSRLTVCLRVFVSDSSGVISLSDICGLQCQIIRCQNWSHSPIPSNLPINSLYLHDQQDLIRPSSMKCWDSFDKSNMLLIFLLNQNCCAAEIVCCYQFLSLLSGVTKISGHHTTPLHTTPLHTTPLHTTPHNTTPHYTTPHHTTPLHTTPRPALPGSQCWRLPCW